MVHDKINPGYLGLLIHGGSIHNCLKNDAGITVGHLLQNIMCYKNNTDFNIVHWAKCNIKILVIKTHHTVIHPKYCCILQIIQQNIDNYVCENHFITIYCNTGMVCFSFNGIANFSTAITNITRYYWVISVKRRRCKWTDSMYFSEMILISVAG